jgi:hypothetical protein
MKNYNSPTAVPYTYVASYIFAILNIWALTNTCLRADSTLSEDYQRLTDRYEQLQTDFTARQDRLRTLNKDTRALEEGWGNCSSQKWRVFWQTTAHQAEENRAKLEEQWKRLVPYGKDLEEEHYQLEQSNLDIKHEFRKKGFKYEKAMRKYMHEFDNYLYDFENTYIHSIDLYITGVETYEHYVNFSLKCCQENNLTQAALDIAGNSANDILEAVKNLKAIFKPEATKTASPEP